MKNHKSEKLNALAINVNQWRQDIKTFVDSTIKELNAINDEISSGFAVGAASAQAPTGFPGQKDDVERPGQTSSGENKKTGSNADQSIKSAPFTEAQTDDRLSTLKRALAEQISQSISNELTQEMISAGPKN